MEADGSFGTSRSCDSAVSGSAASGSGNGDATVSSHSEGSMRRKRDRRASRYSVDSSASGAEGGDEVLGRLLKDILRHKAKDFNGEFGPTLKRPCSLCWLQSRLHAFLLPHDHDSLGERHSSTGDSSAATFTRSSFPSPCTTPRLLLQCPSLRTAGCL